MALFRHCSNWTTPLHADRWNAVPPVVDALLRQLLGFSPTAQSCVFLVITQPCGRLENSCRVPFSATTPIEPETLDENDILEHSFQGHSQIVCGVAVLISLLFLHRGWFLNLTRHTATIVV